MTIGERETCSWDDLGSGSRNLARAIVDSGYEPDIVLAIARGGLLVAGALGYALGLKNVFTLNVEFYTGVDERLELPVILPPMPDLVSLSGLRVLIADDVADTGETIRLVRQTVAEHVEEARTAVLFEKPHSVEKCDYVYRRTSGWVTFAWSAEPPLGGARHTD